MSILYRYRWGHAVTPAMALGYLSLLPGRSRSYVFCYKGEVEDIPDIFVYAILKQKPRKFGVPTHCGISVLDHKIVGFYPCLSSR